MREEAHSDNENVDYEEEYEGTLPEDQKDHEEEEEFVEDYEDFEDDDSRHQKKGDEESHRKGDDFESILEIVYDKKDKEYKVHNTRSDNLRSRISLQSKNCGKVM